MPNIAVSTVSGSKSSQIAGIASNASCQKAKRGESGIEPETSRTLSANHTTRLFTLSDFREFGTLLTLNC